MVRARWRTPAQFGVNAGDAERRLRRRRWPASSRSSTSSCKGLAGLLKSRKVTVYDGTGTLGADRTVTVTGCGRRGDRRSTGTDVDPRLGLGARAPSPASTSTAARPHLRRGLRARPRCPARPSVIGGGAIGCEFASMLADLGLPGDDPRGAAEDPARRATPTCPSSSLAAFKRRGIDVRTGRQGRRATTPGDGGTTVRFGDGEPVEVDVVVVSVGRRPLSETLGLDGTGVEVDERGFVDGRRVVPHRRVDGVWAVGDLIATPGLAHVGFAEAIVVDQADPRRARRAGRLRQGAVGDLLPSRGGLRRALRGRRPRRPGSTSSCPSTAGWATAGR